jgi:membrane associated rhomboid family serine protease
MGIYNRDYARPYQDQHSSMGSGFKGMPPVVKWLLIINFAVFMIDALVFPDLIPENKEVRFTVIDEYLSVFPISLGAALQPWRVITYQFLHGDIMHLAFNLLVLYFMGPFVERSFGSRAFLKFYLICGAAGGIIYTLLASVGILDIGPMVGASGAIYGLMIALAVMFPQMKVLLWGIIPMTMVRLVILLVIVSLITIAFGHNVGGEAAHLSGLAMGFLYMKYKPWVTRRRMERQKGAWAQKIERERNFQSEVDRTLDKVRREGINSLSDNEKKILQEATRREQVNQ